MLANLAAMIIVFFVLILSFLLFVVEVVLEAVLCSIVGLLILLCWIVEKSILYVFGLFGRRSMTERDKELIIEELRQQYIDGKITGAELADRVASTCEQYISEQGPPGYENNDWGRCHKQ